MDNQMVIMNELAPVTSAPRNPQIFGNAAIEVGLVGIDFRLFVR